MDALKRFRDETFSKRYSDELLAERKWNKKTLIFIFIASTLFYTSDILISNFCLNVRKLPIHELVLVLALLGARAVGFFYYLKYERNAYPRVFQVYELFFVLLFGATTIATWNAEINMDMKRSFIIGIDAGWVLRYILVLFGQWKFKAFIDLSVVIFGIIKLAIFVKAFDMGYIQAGVQMVFVLMLLYSKERVEKMKFLRTVSLKRTEQTLKNILDNIPENIGVLNLDGDLIYFNEYLDICFGVNNQDPDEIDLFSKFFSIKPRERYFNAESWAETDHMSRPLRRKTIRKLPMRKITLTPQNFKVKEFIEHNRHLKEESEFTGKKQNMLNNSNLDKSMTESKPSRSRMKDSHASLTEAITSIEQFSSLQDVIDFFVANIANLRSYSNKANNFFIFDSKYKETDESTVKSYEIKISLASFDGDESFIVILRDTTHRDIIATLESNNTYKDSVLSSISHELRTPLNTNLNMLDMAIKDPDTSEQLKEERLIPAHQSGKLLQSLINDILDYSMSLAGKLVMSYKTKSLRKTLEKVKYLAESQAKRKNLDFHIRISDKISNELYTDHKRLRQVLVNLLSNALKFTSEGEIVLSVDEWGEENKIIKFAVSDTGIGMTDADMDRLRAVFKKNSFSEKLTGSSAESGMGLMMSQMLIKKMGPRITKLSGLKFESRHGEGSTFWFFINSKSDTPITSSFQEGNRENYFNYQQTTGGNQSSSPPRQLTEPNEPKEGENNIMNTDASSSQIRLIDARRKLTRRPTYEPILQGTHENLQTNGSMLEREATLGDEDQFEEERACMIKNNNLILGKSMNDLSSTEGRRLPHPRLLSTTPIRTKESALNLPEIKIAFADDDGHGGCDCPKILVVDDDVFNLFTMKSLMKGFGLTITEAHNGVQAVEAVKKRVETKCSERCQGFRLILMDLSMPVMDGFEATLKLKELMALGQVPYIPIVACTAFVDPDKTAKCFKCGMQSRISKPVSKNKLQEVLRTYNIPFI